VETRQDQRDLTKSLHRPVESAVAYGRSSQPVSIARWAAYPYKPSGDDRRSATSHAATKLRSTGHALHSSSSHSGEVGVFRSDDFFLFRVLCD
ncbi:hypothetical protein, partial [Caballeronia grimmiae]|uniref:hypothetical protein n=1 Tax=Caballeronia grimmiae TaxID=1071679 RepID=UPI0038B8451F